MVGYTRRSIQADPDYLAVMTTSTATLPRRTAIVTDSAAALSPALTAKHGITVAPMTIRVGSGDEVNDVPGTDYSDVYSAVARNPDVSVTVSAPLPRTWCDAMITAASGSADVDSVLVVTMSARYSASYDAAMVGAEMATEQLREVTLAVMDSDTVAGAQALVCMAAADVADAGSDLEAVKRAATDASRRVKTVAMLGALDQIHRVGRVPGAALWAAQSVGLKPVVGFDSSGFQVVARPLSRRWGLRKVVSAVVDGMGDVRDGARVVVMHVQSERDALRVAREIESAHGNAIVTVCEMHPFAGVPAGAGTVGAAWLGTAIRPGWARQILRRGGLAMR